MARPKRTPEEIEIERRVRHWLKHEDGAKKIQQALDDAAKDAAAFRAAAAVTHDMMVKKYKAGSMPHP